MPQSLQRATIFYCASLPWVWVCVFLLHKLPYKTGSFQFNFPTVSYCFRRNNFPFQNGWSALRSTRFAMCVCTRWQNIDSKLNGTEIDMENEFFIAISSIRKQCNEVELLLFSLFIFLGCSQFCLKQKKEALWNTSNSFQSKVNWTFYRS